MSTHLEHVFCSSHTPVLLFLSKKSASASRHAAIITYLMHLDHKLAHFQLCNWACTCNSLCLGVYTHFFTGRTQFRVGPWITFVAKKVSLPWKLPLYQNGRRFSHYDYVLLQSLPELSFEDINGMIIM